MKIIVEMNRRYPAYAQLRRVLGRMPSMVTIVTSSTKVATEAEALGLMVQLISEDSYKLQNMKMIREEPEQTYVIGVGHSHRLKHLVRMAEEAIQLE